MSIVPFLIHGRFFEEEEKRPYEKVYEATTGGEGESRMTEAEKEKSLLNAQKIWADKWKVNNRIVNGSRPHKVLPREQK